MSDRGRSPGPGGPSERRPSQSPAGRSTASGPQGGGNWPSGLGFDPAKPTKKEEKGNTRMELPPDAYVSETRKDAFTLRGNKLNTEGQATQVEVNQYRMTKFDFSKKIYQYDVIVSPEPTKLGPVMKKILNTPICKQNLQKYKGDKWLFDGKKLAWAPVLVSGQLSFRVDLDEGRQDARAGNTFEVTLRNTNEIKVSALQGYLDHKTSFNTAVQEALNFLDHLVRQWPSQHLLAIKRNFYKQSEAGQPLGDGGIVEVHKGSYTSVRMSHNIIKGGIGLGYNVDVANTCFWLGRQSMDQLMANFLATCDNRWRGLNGQSAHQHLKPVKGKGGRLESSDAFKQLRKLRKLKFTIRHPNRRDNNKLYNADDFMFDENCGPEGANAKTSTFDYEGQSISVQDYYKKRYNVTLKYANLPLIKAGKNGMIPMEFAWIEPMQRYPFKLNPDQTTAMIKIAVTPPSIRKANIQRNVADLQIGTDPYLKEWDLRGKKFWAQNPVPLISWGFIVLEREVPLPVLQQFASTFKTTFIGHGGKVTKDAQLLNPPGDMRFNAATALAWAHDKLTKSTGYPQLIFCVVSTKNSGQYERLKKSADCRFGVLTQVILNTHVQKNQGQYHSNVCMKVNAKLGGATACTPPLWKTKTYFPQARNTMIVGVDVSHGAPGGNAPSTAAMTMSIDPDATRYAAVCETNGYRVEILTPANIRKMFGQLANFWRAGHGGKPPAHVIYFRDGVGEGQFAYVLDNEIAAIKEWFKNTVGIVPKFTVIVATKRHHIRFFPQRGDKNNNPLPGTLVEKEVTHPFMMDFYICSHVAIKGTARPVHYHILLDEMNIPVNEFQKMIYHQCYSYARSTTPVSLHPAVYYAHLASSRARAHENIATSEGFRAGPKGHEMIRDKIAKGQSVGGHGRDEEAPPLLTLGGKNPPPNDALEGEIRQRNFFRQTMWYI
ncbi:Fc.00g018310.m01.CDS01 [Cosmosporella sp. VM-42]